MSQAMLSVCRLCSIAVLVAGTGPALAHHSIARVYDSAQQVTVEGVVTEFRFVNPHPMLIIEVDIDGTSEAWQLEMDNRGELTRIGFTAETFRPGERVVASGSLHRAEPGRLYLRRLDRLTDGLRYEQRGSTPTLELGER